MDVAALVISLVALAVGAAGLGWNVASFFMQGQRARLSLTPMRAFAVGHDTAYEPFIQLTVASTGRQSVEVTGWSLSYDGDKHVHSAVVEAQLAGLDSVPQSAPLPSRIEPGHAASFNIPTAFIENGHTKLGLDPNKGHVQVYFAARRRLRDRRSLAKRLVS